MKVILSDMCLSLVGMINTDLGYFLVKRGKSFFSQRSGHGAPPDGHLRFIFLCAELVQNHLYLSDLCVSGYELKAALQEAAFLESALRVDVDYEYNAAEVLQLKTTFGL